MALQKTINEAFIPDIAGTNNSRDDFMIFRTYVYDMYVDT